MQPLITIGQQANEYIFEVTLTGQAHQLTGIVNILQP